MMNLSTWRVDVAVCGAVRGTVGGAVDQAVFRTVYRAVTGVVYETVGLAVNEVIAQHEGPPHPGLSLYLGEVS